MSTASTRRRWLARASLAAAAAALVLLVAMAGSRTLALVALVVGHFVLLLVGAWLALAHRGWRRVAGIALAVGAEVTLVVAEASEGLLWVVWASAGLLVLAFLAGRAALLPESELQPGESPEPAAEPATHPFLVMNPRSGGGKAEAFGLREKAEALGVEVAVLEGPGTVDVAELARAAVRRGADLLGVAGGDGTQALVAAVAADAGVPMFVVPAGTRNHFALDLGLDRGDLAGSLEALTDGVDLRVDLGDVGGRPFVNNVSFGGYAAIVERPDYREDKLRVTLSMLPELLSGEDGAGVSATADGEPLPRAQALLVSNNRYGTGDPAGLGRRPHLDDGVLGVVGVRVASAADSARLLLATRSRDLTRRSAHEVVVTGEGDQVPAGIDGETVLLPSPVRVTVRPGALRVRVPRHRPGQAREAVPVRPGDLVRLGFTRSG